MEFKKWMVENYGIQDANAYKGTMTEEICLKFAEDYHNSIHKEDIENFKQLLKAIVLKMVFDRPLDDLKPKIEKALYG